MNTRPMYHSTYRCIWRIGIHGSTWNVNTMANRENKQLLLWRKTCGNSARASLFSLVWTVGAYTREFKSSWFNYTYGSRAHIHSSRVRLKALRIRNSGVPEDHSFPCFPKFPNVSSMFPHVSKWFQKCAKSVQNFGKLLGNVWQHLETFGNKEITTREFIRKLANTFWDCFSLFIFEDRASQEI